MRSVDRRMADGDGDGGCASPSEFDGTSKAWWSLAATRAMTWQMAANTLIPIHLGKGRCKRLMSGYTLISTQRSPGRTTSR